MRKNPASTVLRERQESDVVHQLCVGVLDMSAVPEQHRFLNLDEEQSNQLWRSHLHLYFLTVRAKQSVD